MFNVRSGFVFWEFMISLFMIHHTPWYKYGWVFTRYQVMDDALSTSLVGLPLDNMIIETTSPSSGLHPPLDPSCPVLR